MRASRFFISTLKEAPSEAEIISHRLMLRAGFIKRLAAGIYTQMPMGLRVLRKVEAIVREEMNRAGALELLMPAVQPAELWQETGRWVQYGPELLRLKDRHQRDFVVGPTHEEVITDVVRKELKSYRQLPFNFYQIQTKFRDETRPRFGVMRGREFIMKDAYSFDRDEASAQRTYDAMYSAYQRVFSRLGLRFRAVAADTGSIGGNRSHEFHVIADTGEDAIAYCPQSAYAANVELAQACNPPGATRAAPQQAMQCVPTPGLTRCEDVAIHLGLPLHQCVRAVVFAQVDAEPKPLLLALVRADHVINTIKLGKLPGVGGLRLATEAEIMQAFGCVPGYLGPVGLRPDAGIRVVADHAVAILADFVCGANQEKHHLTGVNWERDMPQPETADIRNVVEGDPSPDGAGNLALCRGIEVGHVFYLGTKYSQALGATFLDEHGKPAVVEMGCYGIGVSRIVGAAIEQYHDDKGMVWPISLAPFEVVLCPIGYSKSEQVREHAQAVYQSLLDLGVDVILDDRDERPGAMFADWELIGVPLRLTLGERGLQKGMVEWQARDGVYEGELQSGEMERKGIVERVYAEVQKRRAHLLQEPLV